MSASVNPRLPQFWRRGPCLPCAARRFEGLARCSAGRSPRPWPGFHRSSPCLPWRAKFELPAERTPALAQIPFETQDLRAAYLNCLSSQVSSSYSPQIVILYDYMSSPKEVGEG